MDVRGTVSNSGILKVFYILSIPVAAKVDLMVSRIGPKWSTSINYFTIGPIRDTIKSSTGIEKKNADLTV